MDRDLIREIERKEEKSEADWTLLKYYKCLAIISEILVSESKLDITSEEAVKRIRKHMQENF